MHLRIAVALNVTALVLASGCSRSADCDGANCLVPDDSGETGDETDAETDDETDAGTDTDSDPDPDDPLLPINKNVDILFVIDNSGSMGEEQALLAANVGAFINVLEQDHVNANYRIGITTTDNGNPWCAGQTTPEGGRLVLSSCKERIDDFEFGDIVDVRDLACNDICTLGAAELEILPTTTAFDPEPKPRPWLESIDGKKNIPANTSAAEAFKCFGPQGVNGCGFESPLESMYLALVRAQTSSEASYGFLRQDAMLAVIFLTDEVDCSYNKDFAQIFDASGNRVFWSDPSADFPTSAVCWNAGVECIGDPSQYDNCDPVNKDVTGNSHVSDAQAVLQPMSRYIGLLDAIEQEKQQFSADQEIIVALIGGVDSSGQPFYADVFNTDPEFQNSYGIGPGCTAVNPLDPNEPIRAVPPVRLRDLTEAFTPGNMFSICHGDYSPALQSIADRIRDQIPPACFPECVVDTNPNTPVVEPSCVLTQHAPSQQDDLDIPECLRDANGYVIDPQSDSYAMPSDAANVCFAMLVDKAGQTADPWDDMTNVCVEEGVNLEFKIVRRPGFPAPGGASVSADCVLSGQPALDCPELP